MSIHSYWSSTNIDAQGVQRFYRMELEIPLKDVGTLPAGEPRHNYCNPLPS
jgi:hypothetical protein